MPEDPTRGAFAAALSFMLMYATFILIALQTLRNRKMEAKR